MALHQTSDATFKADVLEATTPVIVDFWAEWCGPCRMLGPILDEAAAELGTGVKIVKMNVDENPNTPGQFGIRSIPTLMLFKGGQLISSKVGVHQKASLVQWAQENS